MDTSWTRGDQNASLHCDLCLPTTSCLRIWLPPRIMHRLRARALDSGQTPERFAARALAAAAVPDPAERGRLAFRDLHEAGLGSLAERRRDR